MNKISKIVISVIIVLILLVGSLYYFLIPKDKMEINANKKLVTIEDLVKGTYIDHFEVATDPVRLKGKLSLSDEEVRNIVYTLSHKYEINELESIYIKVINNKINVFFPYEIFGFIKTQCELEIVPSVVNDNLIIELRNLKLGKIKLSDKILANNINKYNNETPFTIKENIIEIDNSFIKPLSLKKINIEKDKIILEIELQLNNLIEFINEHNLKVIA